MKKHWTEFLPEAGTIANRGKDQMYLNCRLEEAKRQVEIYQREYEENEKEIHQTALKAWAWAEIDEAKTKAIITQRTPEEQKKVDDDRKLLENWNKKNEVHPVFQNILKTFMP